MGLPEDFAGEIPQVLKAARKARGMSQREVAALAGLTQSRLAGIEAGKIDLRVSTLVEIARALELELLLVPRQTLPAVQALLHGTRPDAGSVDRAMARRAMDRMGRQLLDLLSRDRSDFIRERAEEALSHIDGLQRRLEVLTAADLRTLLRVGRWLKRAAASERVGTELDEAVAGLRDLHTLARSGRTMKLPAPGPERAAYSLEDEEEP